MIPLLLTTCLLVLTTQAQDTMKFTYPLVDTNQGKCYDANTEVACPPTGGAFYGQDAQYTGNAPRYQDNGDGTVSDLITGLMWQQDPGSKMTFAQAEQGAATFNLAGYMDWRLPTIKELYSLILFDGTDASTCSGTCSTIPFIDARYFNFSYGDTTTGERVIDSQFATSTLYGSTTMGDNRTMFGVNFADGRIKGYPIATPGDSQGKTFFVLYVRGNPAYGQNAFADNGNGTISDSATGLTWMQADSGVGMNWGDALNYCENLNFAGASDWRLPNTKELQSILDYSRAPDTTGSAAIDPLFQATAITNEAGQTDYPVYWSSTTHISSNGDVASANYVVFGRALGYMNNAWVDVHGAGAQRSDPKIGSAVDYPQGHGPQGDAVRINNYVRCTRGGAATLTLDGSAKAARPALTIEGAGTGQSAPAAVPTTPVSAPPTLPANPPSTRPGQGGAPPQEAINACSGSTIGATCQINTPTGIISGTCQSIQQQLACVPANRP
ncbi:MAG: DUF1566 domain-containing protein [Anaerolineaceae bacterium]|nr:DUF1566 domain-containing protein [Anaerolineaceae bacterium]